MFFFGDLYVIRNTNSQGGNFFLRHQYFLILQCFLIIFWLYLFCKLHPAPSFYNLNFLHLLKTIHITRISWNVGWKCIQSASIDNIIHCTSIQKWILNKSAFTFCSFIKNSWVWRSQIFYKQINIHTPPTPPSFNSLRLGGLRRFVYVWSQHGIDLEGNNGNCYASEKRK